MFAKHLKVFTPGLSSIRFVIAIIILSIINLIAITLERYLKVVHPYWSKKYLKRWMIHAAIVFAWIAGILNCTPVAFVTTLMENGVCLGYHWWESQMTQIITSIWYVFAYSIFPVVTFVFCYARIVVVMRKQAKVMAAHNVEGLAQMSAAQIQNKRIKWNIIKTMIIVSACTLIYF